MSFNFALFRGGPNGPTIGLNSIKYQVYSRVVGTDVVGAAVVLGGLVVVRTVVGAAVVVGGFVETVSFLRHSQQSPPSYR